MHPCRCKYALTYLYGLYGFTFLWDPFILFPALQQFMRLILLPGLNAECAQHITRMGEASCRCVAPFTQYVMAYLGMLGSFLISTISCPLSLCVCVCVTFTFTFSHLADAFIQSDLHILHLH